MTVTLFMITSLANSVDNRHRCISQLSFSLYTSLIASPSYQASCLVLSLVENCQVFSEKTESNIGHHCLNVIYYLYWK